MTSAHSQLYLLYADESNLQRRSGDFFVYAGLAFPFETAGDLCATIGTIRQSLGVPSDYQLKFNPGPADLDHQEVISLKRQVLGAAADAGARMFVTVTLHDVVKYGDSDEARRMGINTILFQFDCYLHLPEVESHGLALLDRFSDPQIDSQVREIQATGLHGLPFSTSYELERILGIHYSAVGQSPFASITDVAVGSLRFAINAHTGSQPDPRGSRLTLLDLLRPVIVGTGTGTVSDVLFAMRPKRVNHRPYLDKYVSLRDFLAGSEINVERPADGSASA